MKNRYKISSRFWKNVVCAFVVLAVLLFLQYEAFIYLAITFDNTARWIIMLITLFPFVLISLLFLRRLLTKGCLFG